MNHQIGREIGSTEEAEEAIKGFVHIVQCQLSMRALDYHASHSLVRMAMNPDEYHERKKSLRKSSFASAATQTCQDSLMFQPSGGEYVTVNRTDYTSGVYAVSIPQRICIGKNMSPEDPEIVCWGTEFDDAPTQTESAARHPGTNVDSDVEEDEDYDTLYPEYRSDEDDAPITTVAAEELACLVFVGSMGQIKGELQAAYPLQLSARIDQSRKCLIFDCFEYKPYQLIDKSQEDISAALPTERGWLRWNHGYHWTNVKPDDEWDDNLEGTEYWGGDAQMEMKKGDSQRVSQELTIYCGLTGHFAYNRCLRYRLPFDNICGIRLQVDDGASNKTSGVVGGDATAVLVLELSRPPPKDAFATRKISSRWTKENKLEIIHDWTPDKAASQASRIYMYGGLNELRQTAALMATKCSRLAKMLKSVNEPTNSLREESSIEYESSPVSAVDKSVQYGRRVTIRRRSYEDLTCDEKQELRSDIRNTICTTCGSVFFIGHSGLTCPNCGDGKWTIDRNWDPVSTESFNGVIDKVAQFEKPKEEDKKEKDGDNKKELKRKSPG